SSSAASGVLFWRSSRLHPDEEEKRLQKGFSSQNPIRCASFGIIPDPTSEPESGSENNKPVNLPPPTKGSDSDSQGLEKVTPHTTASVSKLQDPTSDPTFGSENQITVATVNSAKVTLVANPENKHVCDAKEEGEIS
ncbi:unnamed protein product, partial [Brassica rapa subsp. trilocularis]